MIKGELNDPSETIHKQTPHQNRLKPITQHRRASRFHRYSKRESTVTHTILELTGYKRLQKISLEEIQFVS